MPSASTRAATVIISSLAMISPDKLGKPIFKPLPFSFGLNLK
jgi:hypothetical protein